MSKRKITLSQRNQTGLLHNYDIATLAVTYPGVLSRLATNGTLLLF